MAFCNDPCLICYKNLAISSGREESKENNCLSQHLSKDLHNIFILKTVFEVPSENLEGYLVERGSPSSWNFIRLCERCEKDVENVKRIYQEILETSRIFTAVKKAIVTKVRQSWRKFEGRRELIGERLVESCTTNEDISSRLILEETRKFICEHDYGPSADPFRDGDLLASSLYYSFYEEESPSPDETMIKVEADNMEDEENSCGEYDELPCDEVDDGEWVVGEVLPLDFAPARPSPSPNDFAIRQNSTVNSSPTISTSSSSPLLVPKAKCGTLQTQMPRKRKQPHKVFEKQAIPSLSFLQQQQTPEISLPKIPQAEQTGANSLLQDRIKIVDVKPNKPVPPLKRFLTAVPTPPPLLTKIKTENYNPHKKKSPNKEFSYQQNLLLPVPAIPLSSFLQKQQTGIQAALIPFQPRIKGRHSSSPPATAMMATAAAAPSGFKCDYPECDRVFTKMCMLTDHKRRHTGERPFQCPWQGCTWKFIRKDELTRHYRIHTGDKPYKCPLCPKEFLRSDHRRKHVESVHKVTQNLSVLQQK